MAKNTIKITANVVDTERPTVAGADKHPGWHALRTLAARVTTPLLPDDYLQAGQPAVVGARAARPGGRGAPGDRRLRDPGHQAGLGLLASTTSPASTSASACWSTAAGAGGRTR